MPTGAGLRASSRAPEDADVIVVNTCGFIGEAKQESIDTILEMARYKEAGDAASAWSSPAACRSATRASWRDEMPEVDHFLGSGEVGQDRRRASRGETPRVRVAEDAALTSTTTSRRAGRRWRRTPRT